MEDRRRRRPSARGVRPRRDRGRDGLHLPRDLHARPRRQRRRRDPRAARASSATTADRVVIANTKGFTGHPMGVGIEDVARGQGARDGDRAAGAELPRPRPGARRAQPVQGRGLPGPLRAPAGGRVRLADHACCCCAGRLSPTAARRNLDELGYDYRIADRAAWEAWLRRASGYDGAAARGRHSTGCASSTRVRPRASRCEPRPRRIGRRRRSTPAASSRAAAPAAPVATEPAAAPRPGLP